MEGKSFTSPVEISITEKILFLAFSKEGIDCAIFKSSGISSSSEADFMQLQASSV